MCRQFYIVMMLLAYVEICSQESCDSVLHNKPAMIIIKESTRKGGREGGLCLWRLSLGVSLAKCPA